MQSAFADPNDGVALPQEYFARLCDIALAAPTAPEPVREVPLRCAIVGDRLMFDIGIDTLCFAVTAYGNEAVVVSDKAAFAREICREICRESEDGSTPLTDMLDAAAQRAIEDGCDGIAEASALATTDRAGET